ncbi:MAG: lipid-A-disaccharide synthase, partial [Pseudomonadota bacterium]
MKSVYIIAGEASGDALGAGLMESLKSQSAAINFAGIGGDQMKNSGLDSLFPYNELSIMGFLEIVPHIPKFLRLLQLTENDIVQKQPDVI